MLLIPLTNYFTLNIYSLLDKLGKRIQDSDMGSWLRRSSTRTNLPLDLLTRLKNQHFFGFSRFAPHPFISLLLWLLLALAAQLLPPPPFSHSSFVPGTMVRNSLKKWTGRFHFIRRIKGGLPWLFAPWRPFRNPGPNPNLITYPLGGLPAYLLKSVVFCIVGYHMVRCVPL
jgi:hypothetical protein